MTCVSAALRRCVCVGVQAGKLRDTIVATCNDDGCTGSTCILSRFIEQYDGQADVLRSRLIAKLSDSFKSWLSTGTAAVGFLCKLLAWLGIRMFDPIGNGCIVVTLASSQAFAVGEMVKLACASTGACDGVAIVSKTSAVINTLISLAVSCVPAIKGTVRSLSAAKHSVAAKMDAAIASQSGQAFAVPAETVVDVFLGAVFLFVTVMVCRRCCGARKQKKE